MALVGHYHLGVVLGRGKFGWVSQATHQVVGHSVAIKHQPWASEGNTCCDESGKHVDCYHVEESLWRSALEKEANLLSRISPHPSVVTLLEVVRRPKELYVCLEYLGDITLASLVSQHYEKEGIGIPELEAACIFKQVAAGLHHLHGEGILHRDVKPENIMVVPGENGLGLIAKLIDLGLAAEWDPLFPLNTSCTRAGTVTYLAPELTSSSYTYGPEVDVFSLGASLYFALIGETPFVEYTRNGKRGTTALFGLQFHHEEALDSLTLEAALLIRSTLDTNPNKRWNLEKLLGYGWLCQDYLSINSNLLKSSLIMGFHDGFDIKCLFDIISEDDGSDYAEPSESNKDSESSEDLVVSSKMVHGITRERSSSKVRIRSLSSSSSSSDNEETKDVLINMECVDQVSLLLQKDNDHILHHLGEHPWGPVGGIYNFLVHSGFVQ